MRVSIGAISDQGCVGGGDPSRRLQFTRPHKEVSAPRGQGGTEARRAAVGAASARWCGAGDDIIATGADDDEIWAAAGNDQVSSDGGTDYVAGGEGDDLLQGQADADTLDGGSGSYTLAGGHG